MNNFKAFWIIARSKPAVKLFFRVYTHCGGPIGEMKRPESIFIRCVVMRKLPGTVMSR